MQPESFSRSPMTALLHWFYYSGTYGAESHYFYGETRLMVLKVTAFMERLASQIAEKTEGLSHTLWVG